MSGSRRIEERGPGDVTTAWVGDWLLTFNVADVIPPARQKAASWQPERQEGAACLWRTTTTDDWRGMPRMILELADWTAWLSGELYGVARSCGAAAAVADVLEGRATAATLNGHFLLLARHNLSGEWHVWTNRHATLHAYLAVNGSRAAVGTFSPSVAAVVGRAELDWEGLTSFFGFGFFGGDRTHFKGVRILRPATHYRLDSDGRLISETRYWHWRHVPDVSRSYDETLEAFADFFAAVIGDLTADGRIALPISGGLDSRSTVAVIAPDAPDYSRLWAYSYGYGDDSVETRIAAEVAAARGLPFDAFTIGPYLFDCLPDIIAAIEGFEDLTQCRQAAVVEEIGRRSDYVISAHLGDLYLDDMGLINAPIGTDLSETALKKIRKGGSDWLLTNICAPRLGEPEPVGVLRDTVAGELARLDAIAEADFRIKAFKVDQWCARWTTVALRAFQPAIFPRLPFYDTRLADFFLTVPTSFVAGRKLQIDYLKRYAPDLARVHWQSTGRHLFRDRRDSLADLGRRAALKGWRRLTGRVVVERNWEIQFAGTTGRAGLTYHLLRSGLPLHEFVAPRAIKDLLDAFQRDPYAEKRSYTVSMLLTFSAWLEQYGGGVVG